MPHKDPITRKAYHKRYGRRWEKKNRRWLKPEYKFRRKKRYNSEKAVAALRQHLYGITPEKYEAKRKRQKNKCALCGRREHTVHYRTKRRQSLSVDHCHKTGVIRGLLCRDCNLALGLLHHDPKLLLNAIKYLKKLRGSNGTSTKRKSNNSIT